MMPSPAHGWPPHFALVLGGGAARGAAHIGVLRSLVEDGLCPDLLVGVSIGAIVGAAFAAEDDPMRALERLREASSALQARFLGFPPTIRIFRILGLFGRRQRREWLEQHLGLNGRRFESLRLPLRVTATRLFPLGRAVFGAKLDEPVVEALMASSALPSRFPVRYGGRFFVDGALAGNLPTLAALEMGARVIVAVNLGFLFRRRDDLGRFFPWRLIDWLAKAQMRWEIARCRRRGAIVIQIGPADFEAESILAFEKLDKQIEAGYKATQLSLPAIRRALQKGRTVTMS